MKIAWAFVPIPPSGPSAHNERRCQQEEKNRSSIDDRRNREDHATSPKSLCAPHIIPQAAWIAVTAGRRNKPKNGLPTGGRVYRDLRLDTDVSRRRGRTIRCGRSADCRATTQSSQLVRTSTVSELEIQDDRGQKKYHCIGHQEGKIVLEPTICNPQNIACHYNREHSKRNVRRRAGTPRLNHLWQKSYCGARSCDKAENDRRCHAERFLRFDAHASASSSPGGRAIAE